MQTDHKNITKKKKKIPQKKKKRSDLIRNCNRKHLSIRLMQSSQCNFLHNVKEILESTFEVYLSFYVWRIQKLRKSSPHKIIERNLDQHLKVIFCQYIWLVKKNRLTERTLMKEIWDYVQDSLQHFNLQRIYWWRYQKKGELNNFSVLWNSNRILISVSA